MPRSKPEYQTQIDFPQRKTRSKTTQEKPGASKDDPLPATVPPRKRRETRTGKRRLSQGVVCDPCDLWDAHFTEHSASFVEVGPDFGFNRNAVPRLDRQRADGPFSESFTRYWTVSEWQVLSESVHRIQWFVFLSCMSFTCPLSTDFSSRRNLIIKS